MLLNHEFRPPTASWPLSEELDVAGKILAVAFPPALDVAIEQAIAGAADAVDGAQLYKAEYLRLWLEHVEAPLLSGVTILELPRPLTVHGSS